MGSRSGRGSDQVAQADPGRRFDLPSLGPQTVEKAARRKLAGIAVAAGETVIAEPSRVAEAADRAGLFVIGKTAFRSRGHDTADPAAEKGLTSV